MREILCIRRRFGKLCRVPEALLLPLLRRRIDRQSLRHGEFVKDNRATDKLGDHFRHAHRPVEEILTGLKFVSRAGIEKVHKRPIAIRYDFFVFEQSKYAARAKTAGNLDNSTRSRAS